MAHDVRFALPIRRLGKADIEFNIRSNGRKIGTLRVSKGSVVWFRRDGHLGHRLPWKQLGPLFESHGRKIERR